jgi:CRP-like cAMP-binding protein
LHAIADQGGHVTEDGAVKRLGDGGARTASIVADGEVETMEVSQGMFRTVIDAYPGLSHQVQLLLCRRIRDLEASHPESPACD